MKANHQVEILLVDDREEDLLALESMLESSDYAFRKAASGNEALRILLRHQDFAIILMDVQMPGMDGFETATMIRQSDKLRHIPIIFLTAEHGREEDIFRAYQSGAVDILFKPVTREILKAKVSGFVELYRKTSLLEKKSAQLKAVNQKLRQQSQYVRRLIEASLDPMVTIDSEGKITDMNKALTRITGLPREKIEGTYFYDYFTRPEIAKQVYQDVYSKGTINDYMLTIRNKSGKLTDVLFNGSVYKDDRGNVLGVVVVAREKLLSKYSRSLIEASLDPLISINAEGKITDFNQALEKITGIEREEITGTDFFDYFTEPDKAREIYKEIFERGFVTDFPLTIRHANGNLTDVLFNGSVYKDDRGNELGVVIVARDITKRKKFEEELIEAKRKAEQAQKTAEEAVKAKQQFLSNMSHEIRTPLNAIIGFTKVVEKTELNDKQREYINAIKISGDALIVLINDILDLAKVEAGKMKFEHIPFNLSSSLSSILHLFEPKIEEKKLKLVKKYDKSIPDVMMGDPVRLHQIIMNLVSNAVKFTEKGGIVVCAKKIKETDHDLTIKFSVTDTGIGIPENKLETIFDNFEQASTGTARVYGGTGLGLSIVKQLVSAQGGTVKVKSRVNEGSVFSFDLTFDKTRKTVEKESVKEVKLDKARKNVRVLVAEDVVLNQLLMKTLLEEFGYDMEVAANGKIAIEKLKEKEFDMVLMDLQMPEMDGMTATKIIRRELKSDIPIIALTADVTTADIDKCRSVGMNDYIAKPIDEKLLFKKMTKYLNGEPSEKYQPMEEKKQTQHEQKYTNLDFLKELTKNNHEAISEMIRVYLEETPQLISAMKESLEKAEWDTLKRTAHSMVPSFATMGIDQKYTLKTRRIQDLAGKQENPEEIKTLIAEIEDVFEKASEELQQELAVL